MFSCSRRCGNKRGVESWCKLQGVLLYPLGTFVAATTLSVTERTGAADFPSASSASSLACAARSRGAVRKRSRGWRTHTSPIAPCQEPQDPETRAQDPETRAQDGDARCGPWQTRAAKPARLPGLQATAVRASREPGRAGPLCRTECSATRTAGRTHQLVPISLRIMPVI